MKNLTERLDKYLQSIKEGRKSNKKKSKKKPLKSIIKATPIEKKIGYFLDKASKHIHGKGYNSHK